MKQTPLTALHRNSGARLVDFSGWEMPVLYSSIRAEHGATRSCAGLFDLCHMGRYEVVGEGAVQALDAELSIEMGRIAVGRARYGLMLTQSGTILDDLIVYRLAETRFLVVANAGNRDPVRERLVDRIGMSPETHFHDRSDDWSLIAIQGPESESLIQPLVSDDLSSLRYYAQIHTQCNHHPALVARTGYTGEDGFEFYIPSDQAPDLWEKLTRPPYEVLPVGLGARDTLRLEAGMHLYGHELDRSTTPYEADLARVVHMEKSSDFVGKQACSRNSQYPAERCLVAFELEGKRVPRQHQTIRVDGSPVGQVTSGTASPTLGRSIGMGYLPPSASQPGTNIEVDIRGHLVPGIIQKRPLYTRPQPATHSA